MINALKTLTSTNLFRRKPSASLALVPVKKKVDPSDSTFYVRHTLTSPSVRVMYYPALKTEAKKMDKLVKELDQVLWVERHDPSYRSGDIDVVKILLKHADVRPIVELCLGLDPNKLTLEEQQLLYLFAVEQTGLLRPTDDNGNFTIDSIALLELQERLSQIPLLIKRLRYDADDKYAHEQLEYLLMHAGMISVSVH